MLKRALLALLIFFPISAHAFDFGGWFTEDLPKGFVDKWLEVPAGLLTGPVSLRHLETLFAKSGGETTYSKEGDGVWLMKSIVPSNSAEAERRFGRHLDIQLWLSTGQFDDTLQLKGITVDGEIFEDGYDWDMLKMWERAMFLKGIK